MEDRETAQMRKYGESKTTQIMMATVPHVISGLGLRKFQADGFLLTWVYYPRIFLDKMSKNMNKSGQDSLVLGQKLFWILARHANNYGHTWLEI